MASAASSASARTALPQFFYAVRKGRKPGVYPTWDACKDQVQGVPNAEYKKFKTMAEAQQFVSPSSPAPEPSKAHRYSVRSSYHPVRPAAQPVSSLAAAAAAGRPVVSGAVAPAALENRPPPVDLRAKRPLESDSPSEAAKSEPSNAVAHASKRLHRSADFAVAYTDGACPNNGKSHGARAGLGVFWGHEHPWNLSEALDGDLVTNQKAELKAAVRAIETAVQNNVGNLEIRSDSQYLVKAMNSWIHSWKKLNWDKEIANKSLFQRLDALVTSYPGKIKFVHVSAHCGEEGNEMADRLAVSGAYKSSR